MQKISHLLHHCARFAVIAMLLTTTAQASTPNSNEKAARQAYYQWCAAISQAKGNSQVMTKFYAPNAILLPTLSAKIMVNHQQGLDDYFKKLTSKKGIRCTTQQLLTQSHDGVVINKGLYTFSYENKAGEVELIPARFSFVYKEINGHWLIISHHSSKLPK